MQGGGQALGELSRPAGHHEQDGRVGRAAQQRREQVDRRGIGPVHVVERQHERPAHREPLEQLAHRPVRAVALVLEHRPAVRGVIGQRREHLRQLDPDVLAQRPDELRIQAGDVLVQRIDEHPERQVALELGRAAGEHGAPTGIRPRRQLGQQARLADPRLALDDQAARAPLADDAERIVDGRHLGGAPNEVIADGCHRADTAARRA